MNRNPQSKPMACNFYINSALKQSNQGEINYYPIFCFAFLLLLMSCSKEKTSAEISSDTVKQQLQKLSELLIEAEKKDDLKGFLKHYDTEAISMPEYQPTLQGINEIETFYKDIFQKQSIKSFQKETEEVINFDKTIVELGTFKKEYTDSESDTILIQNGKYCNVWGVLQDGSLKLKGETFGFFHSVEHPEALVVPIQKTESQKSLVYLNQEIPFELKAYNALMEKGVRERDGILRSEFFTKDARFMPFADSTKSGIDKIKPYLIAYNSGKVTIDSISVYTYHYEYLGDDILEYAKFYVKWTVPQFSGKTEGKGIRIWKRQADKSLKLYREIGTHDHLE